jgi:uncharacterized protein YfaP (DUF2135 family)
MAEKLETCPRCNKPLRDAGYDLQHCPCGWDRLAGLEDDPYQGTVARFEPNLAAADQDASLASIAISLKRAADALEQISGWLNGNGAPLAIEQLGDAIQRGIFYGRNQ